MPDPTTPPATDTAKPSKARVAKEGDIVNLVLANGSTAKATVNKVNKKNNTVDLTADVGGNEVVITSSPADPEGKQSDSWHFAE